MKRVLIEGKVCVGPTFSKAEFTLIKRNLGQQRGLTELAHLFGLAGNNQRLKILYLLHAHKEMCVCDLAEILEITDSAVSQHLRKLRDRNVVQSRRKGQTIYYSVAPGVFTENIRNFFSMNETRVHSLVQEEST